MKLETIGRIELRAGRRFLELQAADTGEVICNLLVREDDGTETFEGAFGLKPPEAITELTRLLIQAELAATRLMHERIAEGRRLWEEHQKKRP